MTNDSQNKILLDRIYVDPHVMVGKATIRGYRLTVEHLLTALKSGVSFDDLVQDYPFLKKEDIEACLLYSISHKSRP